LAFVHLTLAHLTLAHLTLAHVSFTRLTFFGFFAISGAVTREPFVIGTTPLGAIVIAWSAILLGCLALPGLRFSVIGSEGRGREQ
ncbi:hypothetical protein NZK35_31220, partial [Stieleria sp. ICT_E10.1]|uniref:hypothetical protein n=1 Tax=Stieleria sedimenti TaxID=2976331 RepID=UPI0021801FA0